MIGDDLEQDVWETFHVQFPSSYDVSVNPDLKPDCIEFDSPYGDTSSSLLISFSTELGSWMGLFSGGYRGMFARAVWSCPNPDAALVVSSGTAYLVDVQKRVEIGTIQLAPIVWVRSHIEQRVLILAGFKDICCIGSDGVRWMLNNVAVDEIKYVAQETQTVTVRAFLGYGYEQLVIDVEKGQLRPTAP
jgi:hypothetical protein